MTEPLDRYVTAMVLTSIDRDPLSLPDDWGVLPAERLATVIDDPTAVEGYDQDRFRVLVRLVCWLTTREVPQEYASRVARLRFMVWSLYFRLDSTARNTLMPTRVRLPGAESLIELGAARLGIEARAARRDWMNHLDAWEDDPWLAHRHTTAPAEFEYDLTLLTATWPGRPDSTPLRLSTTGTDTADEDHHRIAADVTESHWLPRASLTTAANALRPRIPFLTWLPLIAASTVLALFLSGASTMATWAALAVLALGLLGVVFLPPHTDFLLLLRIPAATLVGSLVLLSLTPRWWLDSSAWRVGAGLLALATLYLAVEARLHGNTPRHALRRGTGVALLGASYAALVNLVMLRFVTPSLTEHGECLLGWWTNSPWHGLPLTGTCAAELAATRTSAPVAMLVLMTGWSFAAGLVAQILWDDRPLTAPLGRLRRVRGGPR